VLSSSPPMAILIWTGFENYPLQPLLAVMMTGFERQEGGAA